jgi:hypothetical protein
VSGIGEVAVLVMVVVVAVVVSIRLGMLLAPRLDRWTGPDDEDDGGEHD